MAGGVGVPTPWWQIPGPVGRDPRAAAQNLIDSAPPGYQYDLVQQKYVPIVGSATDALSQRAMLESALGLGGSGTGTIGSATTGSASNFPTVPYGDGGGSAAPSVPFQWPQGGGGGATYQPTARIAAPDDSAAVSAVWNRAKDQVGKSTSASLTALRSALASRGLLGGGIEGKSTANVLTAGAGQLADTSRQQAINEAARQDDFAKLGYQGSIEQRGQDITTSEGAANRALDAAKAQFSGGIAQRGQDIDSSNTRFQGGVTMRGQDITRDVATRQQNLTSLSNLIGKLY